MKINTKHTLGAIALLLFSFYYVSNNVLWHKHIINNVKVVHSHPYSDSSHQHSNSNLLLIQSLNNWQSYTTDAIIVSVAMYAMCLLVMTIKRTEDKKSEPHNECQRIRPPPVAAV